MRSVIEAYRGWKNFLNVQVVSQGAFGELICGDLLEVIGELSADILKHGAGDVVLKHGMGGVKPVRTLRLQEVGEVGIIAIGD